MMGRNNRSKTDSKTIVYYQPWIASHTAYKMLTAKGFTNVRRFAGGLREWEEAGYPLEGEAV